MTRRSLSVLALVLVVAGCSGSSDPKGPTATVGSPRTTESTTTTTAKPATPEAEVEAAYLKSWDVYAKAMRALDDSKYDEVFADDALKLRRDEVAALKGDGTPVRIEVKHEYSIQVVDEGQQAVVVDSCENHSVLLDSKTGEPIEADPNNTLKLRSDLRKVDGTWKVVHIFDAA